MAEPEAILTRILKSQDGFTKLIEWDGSGNPIYIGDAEPGTLSSSLKWRIKKISWDGSGNPISIKWAEGSREFKYNWDIRSDYTYS